MSFQLLFLGENVYEDNHREGWDPEVPPLPKPLHGFIPHHACFPPRVLQRGFQIRP